MNPTLDGRTAGLLFVATGWALFLALVGSPEILLFTAPVFLLAAPLALGRYVGEEAVVALSRAAGPARRTRTAVPSVGRLTRRSVPGALLIASNLAGRAPPAAV